ncbi:MAG: PdaC/SigV domain-containing protein, partial [Fusobacteriaceae bacterium]|uniref:PdaC/SigV domain-containing protein n=1 Tax=Romboutsia sp. TaxID=1965302 RepID=UPI003F2A5455
MKKKVMTITITSILLITTLVGCSSNKIEREKTIETQSERAVVQKEKFTTYKIEEKEYINKDMKVKYPQISGLEDEKKQEIINNLIKTKAISIYDETFKELENGQTYEVDGTYEIKLKDDKILSIAYTSYNNISQSAYPYNLFYTTNIDIKTGQELALKEIIPKVDDDFIKLLKQGKYVGPVEKEYQEQLMKFVYSN